MLSQCSVQENRPNQRPNPMAKPFIGFDLSVTLKINPLKPDENSPKSLVFE